MAPVSAAGMSVGHGSALESGLRGMENALSSAGLSVLTRFLTRNGVHFCAPMTIQQSIPFHPRRSRAAEAPCARDADDGAVP